MLGELGLPMVSTWNDSARYAVALMFLFTGTLHFTGMKEDFARMIPKPLPNPMGLVYVTGFLQVLGAAGLLVPAFKAVAGFFLVLLLVSMFPANMNAAKNAIPFRGKPPTPLWQRSLIQIVFVGITWWSSQSGVIS
jgi:uncharacterized membrane protein